MNDLPPGFAIAPTWALDTGILGRVCIWSATVLFLLSAILWILRPNRDLLERPAKLAFALGCLAIFGAFGSLLALFVKDQFEFQTVFEHGDSLTDLKYKIAGIWSAQEGSILLWATTSSLFSLVFVRFSGLYRRWFTVSASVFLATVAAMLAYETPFNVAQELAVHGHIFVPAHGGGMTPSLQNYWVVIHPPTIFSGFGCLTIFFGMACAALLQRNAIDWVRIIRPWVLLAIGILGVGICMGGLWAYETQGWGGFWSWDPVESASFIPWLFLVVLAHGIIVQTTRNKWASTNILLGALPFLTFFWGTFLTRSGLLDNVSLHSFADMDKSAKGILCWSMVGLLTAFAVIYGLLVKKATADVPKPADEPQGLNREAFYRFGMVVVGMFAVVVTLGMSWPVIVATIQHSTGSKVEEWLYHQVTVWFFIPIMLLMAITPFVSWKGEGFRTLWARLFSVVCISIGLTGFAQMGLMSPQIGVRPAAAASVAGPFHTSAPLVYWMLLLLFLCIFVLVANMWRLGEILKRSPLGVGGFIAHAGMAVLMGGLILSRGYEQKQTVFVRKGAPAFALDGYLITYKDATKLDPFDRNGKVFFTVHPPTGADYEISPGLYKYGDPDDPKEMVWPYIQRTPTHDMYFSMNPPVFTAWEKPVLIKPGESSSIDGAQVEYLSPTMKGKPGTMGVTFGAKLRVTVEDELGEVHQYIANPSVQLTENGLAASLAPVGKDYLIAMIGGMDASDRGVQLMLFFNPPIFPITVYYKPLTYLVWLGPAIMAFGALLAGWSRRPPSARKAPVPVVASGRPAKGRVTAPGGEPA